MTRISVCLATYNGARYIKQQLDSILHQLTAEDEIIVSDDSSSDDTLRIISSYNEPRIKIFPNQKFRSPIYNFEHAMKQAQGEFIFLSDQDDLWLDEKVSTALKALQNSDIFLSDCKIINAQNEVIEESFYVVNGSGRGFFKNLFKNSYLGCCLAFRREILKVAIPFPKDVPMHDWWLGMISESFFRIHLSNEPLICYRRHGINATPTGEISNFAYYKRVQFRWALVKGLFFAWLRK